MPSPLMSPKTGDDFMLPSVEKVHNADTFACVVVDDEHNGFIKLLS